MRSSSRRYHVTYFQLRALPRQPPEMRQVKTLTFSPVQSWKAALSHKQLTIVLINRVSVNF